MNELERLAGELTEILGESGIYYEHKCVIEQAAAILLAASKVDVAGLMELVAKVSNAAYLAGLQDANGEGCDATAQTLFEDELETALRMALATREWVGLTDAEIEMIESVAGYFGASVTETIREAEAKLKEKNA